MAIEKAVETQYGVTADITVIKQIKADLDTGKVDITYYSWKDSAACSAGAAPLDGVVYSQSLSDAGALLQQVLTYAYNELLELPKFEGGTIVPDPVPNPPEEENNNEEEPV